MSTIHHIRTAHADVWIGCDGGTGHSYAYGGTRMVPVSTPDEKAVDTLIRLMLDESQLKNRLINSALRAGVLDEHKSRLPKGFLASSVGGARCVIRPHTPEDEVAISNPVHWDFERSAESIFAHIGDFLNAQDGRIKLTPDFGRFASFANILRKFTPHVLGIACEIGGCGGKTSYSTTGVAAAFEEVRPNMQHPITLIGSAGAMWSEFLQYLKATGYRDIAVADIAYGASAMSVEEFPVLASKFGTFTQEGLGRGGTVVATTVGNELENADLDALKPETLLLLAHNHSVPPGEAGHELMQAVAARDVLALPGQILTLGGALTSRVEWFWRQSRPDEPFDKPLAHDVVRVVVRYWVRRCVDAASSGTTTPYEAMLAVA
jgi:hypothetical protein